MAGDKTDKTDKANAAFAYAEKEVRGFINTEPPKGEAGRDPVTVFLWWQFHLSWEDGPKTSYVRVSASAAYALCDLALEHEGVRKLVMDIIVTHIENEMPLSPDLSHFAILALDGELPKPRTKKGPKLAQRFERDMFLIWTLSHMEAAYDVPPTEGDERNPSRQPNGMGILAKCFRDCGRHDVTARAIKEVWLDKSKRKWADRIDEAIRDYKAKPLNALAG